MSSALSIRPGSLTTNVIDDPQVDATAQDNIMTGAGVVFAVQIDNSANTDQDVFVKIWNNINPTVGTDAAHMVLKGPAGTTKCYSILQGIAFGTGISYACVTAAATAGTTPPTSPGKVIMQVS